MCTMCILQVNDVWKCHGMIMQYDVKWSNGKNNELNDKFEGTEW